MNNQCDGCQRGIPVVNGVHKDEQCFGMGCSKGRYTEEPEMSKHDHIEELQKLVATIRDDGELTDIVLYNVCVALEDFIDTIKMEIRDDDWS